MQRDVLDDSVALVEDAEHCDALRHGRRSALPCRGCRDAARCWPLRSLLLIAAVARRQPESDQQGKDELSHAYSGIHGS